MIWTAGTHLIPARRAGDGRGDETPFRNRTNPFAGGFGNGYGEMTTWDLLYEIHLLDPEDDSGAIRWIFLFAACRSRDKKKPLSELGNARRGFIAPADGGNRTPNSSLGSWRFTTKLHPRVDIIPPGGRSVKKGSEVFFSRSLNFCRPDPTPSGEGRDSPAQLPFWSPGRFPSGSGRSGPPEAG